MKIIMHDGSVCESTFEEELGRNALRHTASHILAQAVKRLFPETKLAIGPSIKDGFYYDFDREAPFSPEDIEAIESEMKKIVKENLRLERFTLPRQEAIALMEEKGEPYKVELINDRGAQLLQAGGLCRPVRRSPCELHLRSQGV